MLDKSILPERSRKLFDRLAVVHEMKPFVLIGGTALTLQIGHRKSLDLDFWLPEEKLDKQIISTMMAALRKEGMSVSLMTPQSQITRAKINGQDLLSVAQDYEIEGVKVTFFARVTDAAYRNFSHISCVKSPSVSFSIMSKDGIFQMKSYLIHHRVRSRDIYDLFRLVKDHGYAVEDILQYGEKIDPTFSVEYAKDLLTGAIPLDKQDEGLISIDVSDSIEEVWHYFSGEIDKVESMRAKNLYSIAAHRSRA